MAQVGALFFILIMPALNTLQMSIGMMLSDQWFLAIVFTGIMMLVAAVLAFMLRDTRRAEKIPDNTRGT
jgi:hypothetical protein